MAIDFDFQNNKIYVNGIEVADAGGLLGNAVQVTPYGPISANNLQTALQQLADQSFRSSTQPSTNVEAGDLWYNTQTDILYVYRMISENVFSWIPVSSATDNSDTLDGGSY